MTTFVNLQKQVAEKLAVMLNPKKGAVGGKVNSCKMKELLDDHYYDFIIILYHPCFKKLVESFLNKKLNWNDENI